MDRMSPTDAGFYYAESENTPVHVGSVAGFEGTATSFGDNVRLLLGQLPLVPRYSQRLHRTPPDPGWPLRDDAPHLPGLDTRRYPG